MTVMNAGQASVAQKPRASSSVPRSGNARKSVKHGAAGSHHHHPNYDRMIGAAISQLHERHGSSRQAILKFIMGHYEVGKDPKAVNSHLKTALKRSVEAGSLKHSTGSGAAGSFRLARQRTNSSSSSSGKQGAAAKRSRSASGQRKRRSSGKSQAGRVGRVGQAGRSQSSGKRSASKGRKKASGGGSARKGKSGQAPKRKIQRSAAGKVKARKPIAKGQKKGRQG